MWLLGFLVGRGETMEKHWHEVYWCNAEGRTDTEYWPGKGSVLPVGEAMIEALLVWREGQDIQRVESCEGNRHAPFLTLRRLRKEDKPVSSLSCLNVRSAGQGPRYRQLLVGLVGIKLVLPVFPFFKVDIFFCVVILSVLIPLISYNPSWWSWSPG